MIRHGIASVLVASTLMMVGCNSSDYSAATGGGTPDEAAGASAAQARLSGSHYSLNLIGMAKGKTADMTGNLGHQLRIEQQHSGNSALIIFLKR